MSYKYVNKVSQLKSNWHEKHDIDVTRSVSIVEQIFNHESPCRRLRGFTDSLILEKHFLNVLLTHKADDTFRVLDVGCGTGELLHRISGHFKNAIMVGLEPNEASVEAAQHRGISRCQFISGGFEMAPSLGIFDFVVCSEVYEHVENPDRLLDVLASILVPGGVLSISTPSGWMYRSPRLYNAYKILTSPIRFWRLHLRPEKHWGQALHMHPAIQPSKLRQRLERRELKVIGRQSAMWWLFDRGIVYETARISESCGLTQAGIRLYHYIKLLESLMNLLPPLRWFESRFILLARKSGT